MAEQLADSDHMPDEHAIRAYSNWADGGWGLIITGTTPVPYTSLHTAV